MVYLGNKRFIFVLKLALIWYLCIFSAGYLTSQTGAVFTDQKQINGVITAGTWESNEPENPDDEEKQDNSKLTFLSKGNQNIKVCEPVSIEVEIKNEGKGDMKRDSSYEVYYIEQGNPKQNGEKVKLAEDEGVIPALKQEDSTKLTYQASKEGMYVFFANQSDDQHKENTWSEKIIVHCPPGQETKTNENGEDTKKQKQEQSVEDAEKDSEAKESKDKAEDTEEAVEDVPDENKESEAVAPISDDVNEESGESEDEKP